MNNKYEIASEIVERIVRDLSERNGYGHWGDKDDPIIAMIRSEWEVMVVKKLYEYEDDGCEPFTADDFFGFRE